MHSWMQVCTALAPAPQQLQEDRKNRYMRSRDLIRSNFFEHVFSAATSILVSASHQLVGSDKLFESVTQPGEQISFLSGPLWPPQAAS